MTKSEIQMMKGVAIPLDNILSIVDYQLRMCKTDFAIIRWN